MCLKSIIMGDVWRTSGDVLEGFQYCVGGVRGGFSDDVSCMTCWVHFMLSLCLLRL